MIQKKRVIALGFFDGIHIGHAALMRRVLEIGEKANLVPSVITFDTQPQNIVNDRNIPLINSPGDRAGLLRRYFGIDDIIFLHFDKATVSMQWDKFIDHLIDEFGARHLVAGNDFRFGHNGEGSSTLLERKCLESGIGCDIIPDVLYDGIVSSSTYIRELLSVGDIERANAFLGHPHVLTDVVHYGYKLGRTLGTPTINMRFPAGVLIPAYGVYATKVYLEDSAADKHDSAEQTGAIKGYDNPEQICAANRHDNTEQTCAANGHIGVTNIGIRPTVDDSELVTAETHILNFQRNLYGRQVRIELHKRLRPESKFSDVTELKEQILKDCGEASEYFADNGR